MADNMCDSNRKLFWNKMVLLEAIAAYSNAVIGAVFPPEKFAALIHQ